MALYQAKQSSTGYPLLFQMVDSLDHVTGKTGLSPTVTISKAGAAFATPAGAVTELSSGWYKVAGNATDTATLGPLVLHASATGADPTDAVYEVVSYDPQDAVRLGLTALPNAVAGANGGLPTGNASGQVAVASLANNAITAAAIAADAIGASELAADAVTEIASGVRTELTTELGRVDVAVSTRLASASYSAPPSAASISTTVWAEATRSLTDKAGFALSAAGIQAIWDALTSALTTVGSVGKRIADNLDATVASRLATSGYTAPDNGDIATILTRTDVATSSRSSHSAADVWAVGSRTLTGFGTLVADIWAYATRVLTAGTNIVLAKGSGVTGLNDLDAAGVRSAVGLGSANLDTQLGAIAGYVDTEVSQLGTDVGTLLTRLSGTRAALLDNLARLDAAVSSRLAATDYTAPDNADVATLVARLTSTRANLLDNLTALDAAISTRLAAGSYTAPDNTSIASIKARTDLIPNSPAAVGSAMTLDLAQAVPTANTAETVGDALNAARAQGFGKWALSGTSLVLYAADGSTIVRTFTLDSATAPTSRT